MGSFNLSFSASARLTIPFRITGVVLDYYDQMITRWNVNSAPGGVSSFGEVLSFGIRWARENYTIYDKLWIPYCASPIILEKSGHREDHNAEQACAAGLAVKHAKWYDKLLPLSKRSISALLHYAVQRDCW